MEIKFRIPAPSTVAATNLLGAAGLLLIVVAIGLLAGVAWAMLAAGTAILALSVLAQHGQQPPAAKPGKKPLDLRVAS